MRKVLFAAMAIPMLIGAAAFAQNATQPSGDQSPGVDVQRAGDGTYHGAGGHAGQGPELHFRAGYGDAERERRRARRL